MSACELFYTAVIREAVTTLQCFKSIARGGDMMLNRTVCCRSRMANCLSDIGNILLSLYPFTLYRYYNEFMSYFILKLVSCQ